MFEISVKKQLGQTLIDAEFTLPYEGITVFYGHSGAGKTSLINMLAGLTDPDSGVISVNGRTLYDSNTNTNLPPEKRRCGYIFQDKRLFPHLTVRGNLLFANKKQESSVSFDETVGILGISHLLERKPAYLSGGEAQRVAVGRAVLSCPDFLLMDEPMSSLDSDRRDELIPFIKRLPSAFNIPVILVTHAYDEMIRLADYVAVFDNGKVVSCGAADKILGGEKICPHCSHGYLKKVFV